jgi:putative ABC transport system permease protein
MRRRARRTTLLAVPGLYGVLAYAVRTRRAEIGVRIAFGVSRPSILGLIVGHGLALSIAGVAAGTLAAFGATRLMSRMLFGVTPTDPGTFASIAGLLLAVAALASALPALRAARVDPAIALRDE